MRYYFFPEDISVLEQMINGLYERIKELGKEQGKAAGQSTENMGHDDACQEAVDQARRTTLGRLNDLGEIVGKAIVITREDIIGKGVFDSVRMGAIVELSDGRIFRIGSFMILADHPIMNISYYSPLARALLNKKEGDEIGFQGQFFRIVCIR